MQQNDNRFAPTASFIADCYFAAQIGLLFGGLFAGAAQAESGGTKARRTAQNETDDSDTRARVSCCGRLPAHARTETTARNTEPALRAGKADGRRVAGSEVTESQ